MNRCDLHFKWMMVSAIVLFTSINTGCMTAVKQAYYELAGAKAKIVLNAEMTDETLADYQSVRFLPLKRSVSDRIVPETFVQAYDQTTATAIVDLKSDYPGGSPALVVEGDVYYFQKRGFLDSALSLTRVRVRAADREIIDAVVIAETKAFREGTGDEALARATVNAVGKMLRTRKNPETLKEDEEKNSKSDRD